MAPASRVRPSPLVVEAVTQVTPRPKKAKKKRPTITADTNACLAYHSLLVRSRGRCEWPDCDKACACPNRPAKHLERPHCPLECSHFISRRKGGTSTDLRNAFALCSAHHRHVHAYPGEHARFALERLGADVVDELHALAQAGIPGISSVFWRERRAELKAMVDEMVRSGT